MTSGGGWYPDPDGHHQLRYHDGQDWTVHVADDGNVTQAARAAPPPPPDASPVAAPGAGQPDDDDEWALHLALGYSAACAALFDRLEAALKVANNANGARNAANKRPQHEISIRNFTNLANDLDHRFVPLYHDFQAAAAEAKEAGIKLAGSSPHIDPETWLLTCLDPEAYSAVAAAVEYLRESYGPTPQAFIDGIGRANQVINTSPNFGEPGFRGNVYTEGIAGAPTSFG